MAKILVIEDEQALREEILDVFHFEGYTVIGAQDGRIGAQRASEQLPDLIICDINMPNMNGYQVLEKLRQNPTTALIPFIFLTAKGERSFMRHGMELGADDYLSKPFTHAELLAAVRARLEKNKATTGMNPLELEQAKKKIARLVVHELRTPMISINITQNLISRQLGKLSPHELEELLETQNVGSRRLSRLIEQLAIIAQFDIGVFNHETIRTNGIPLPIHKLLTGAIHLARRFAYRNYDAEIYLTDDAENDEIICDNQFMKHALAELITNALNYSPEGGEVMITCHEIGENVQITIMDQGSGIPQELLEEASREFQQIDRETQEQQGLGMGLPLAQRIIEAHGGTLALASGEGQGTQAIVNLPLAAGNDA